MLLTYIYATVFMIKHFKKLGYFKPLVMTMIAGAIQCSLSFLPSLEVSFLNRLTPLFILSIYLYLLFEIISFTLIVRSVLALKKHKNIPLLVSIFQILYIIFNFFNSSQTTDFTLLYTIQSVIIVTLSALVLYFGNDELRNINLIQDFKTLYFVANIFMYTITIPLYSLHDFLFNFNKEVFFTLYSINDFSYLLFLITVIHTLKCKTRFNISIQL